MPFIEANGANIYYESHGDGPAIVFAHGAGGNHLSWWQQVPYFRERYRCITFDHRGFGRSVDPGSTPAQRAFPEDMRGLLDALGIDRAFLVAQSMGGGACLGFTVAYPGRVLGLVMADTTGTIDDDDLRDRVRAFRDSQPAPFTLQGRAYNPELASARPELAFLYDSIMALNPPREQPGTPVERDPRHIATAEKRAALMVPTLFICGSEDAIVPPSIIKYASTLFPAARYFEAPGCGHSVYFEDAPAFNATVDEFAATILKTRASARA
jgi:3-oxoadipate enol-lactonase